MTFGEIVAEAEREWHAGGMPQLAKQEDVRRMATGGSAGGTSAGKSRSYTGQYLAEILARSERIEAGPAIKLSKARGCRSGSEKRLNEPRD